jgi:hypothetical protein
MTKMTQQKQQPIWSGLKKKKDSLSEPSVANLACQRCNEMTVDQKRLKKEVVPNKVL